MVHIIHKRQIFMLLDNHPHKIVNTKDRVCIKSLTDGIATQQYSLVKRPCLRVKFATYIASAAPPIDWTAMLVVADGGCGSLLLLDPLLDSGASCRCESFVGALHQN
jgi:hypothetical protein